MIKIRALSLAELKMFAMPVLFAAGRSETSARPQAKATATMSGANSGIQGSPLSGSEYVLPETDQFLIAIVPLAASAADLPAKRTPAMRPSQRNRWRRNRGMAEKRSVQSCERKAWLSTPRRWRGSKRVSVTTRAGVLSQRDCEEALRNKQNASEKAQTQ